MADLQKRLEKIESLLNHLTAPADWSNCNCRDSTIADAHKPQEFEVEMNTPCAKHGVRSLGMIVRIEYAAETRCARLDQLLEIYKMCRSPEESRRFRFRRLRRAIPPERSEFKNKC